MAGLADEALLARELEDLREQQRAISGVLRAVAQSAGLQPVLDEVVEACKRLCRADYGALYLLEHGLLHVVAHNTEAEGAEWDRQHPHALDRTTAAGRAALTREPVHIPDIRNDPEYSYGGPQEYYRATLGVPIMVENQLIGAVVLVRREPDPYTDEHIALVQTFADQAAIAITNARLIEAVERQRTELARFLSRRWRSSSRAETANNSSPDTGPTSRVCSAICADSQHLRKPPRPRSCSTSCASTTGRSAS
jgi:two-component system, NtrC family, sensor kinase